MEASSVVYDRSDRECLNLFIPALGSFIISTVSVFIYVYLENLLMMQFISILDLDEIIYYYYRYFFIDICIFYAIHRYYGYHLYHYLFIRMPFLFLCYSQIYTKVMMLLFANSG